MIQVATNVFIGEVTMTEAKDESKGTDKQTPDASRPSYLRGPLPKKGDAEARSESENNAGKGITGESIPQAAEQEKEDVELYSWKVWLLPLRPGVSTLVVASVAGCIGLAYWAFPQFFFVAVMTLILLNRLAVYLFPVKYVITEQTVGYRTFLARDIRSWDKFLTYYQFHDGVLLSHDTRTVRGRMKQGMFLYYYPDGSNKDTVLEIVSSRLTMPEQAFSEKDELVKKEKKERGGIRAAIERIRNIKPKE
jgi:hypothetical protein